jgi:hypothetical protein
MAQFIQFPIDASATIGGPSLFQTLVTQSSNTAAAAATPTTVATEIQDEVTLSQQALSSSSTNLLNFPTAVPNPSTANQPVEAATTAAATIPTEPSVFQTLVDESTTTAPTTAVTPSLVDSEIQDEVTLSQQALSSSSATNLLNFPSAVPDPFTANLPIEAANTGIPSLQSQVEQLLYDGFQIPQVAYQLALNVSTFENNVQAPTLNVAA